MSTLYTVGSGKTYSTIAAAKAAIPSNISGTGIHEVVIDAGSYNEQLDFTTITGQSASDYISIHAATGSEHKGIIGSGVRINANTYVIKTPQYTLLNNLIFNGTGGSNSVIYVRDYSVITNVIMKDIGGNPGVFTTSSGGTPPIFISCVAYTTTSNVGYGFGYYGNYYNCGAYGFGVCYPGTSPNQIINCWAVPGLGGSSAGFTSSNTKNNACTNDVFTGVNSFKCTLAQMGFVNAAGYNFHLTNNSILLGKGFDLSSIFTSDIDGETITNWCIGPDFLDVPTSFKISGAYYKVRPWPQFILKPAIAFVQNSKGYWTGSDRGAAQDIYESYLTFQGTDTTINNLNTALNAARESITLSGFNTDIFTPNVDQTGSVTASITDFGQRKQLQFNGAAASVFEATIGFRAISPTILSTTPSLSSLKLQEGWEGDHSTEIAKGFSLTQSGSYADRNSDSGKFIGRFSQSTTQLKAILAYLLVTVRGASMVFPTLSGVTYPFGISKGTGPFNVVVYSIQVQRQNLNRWTLTLDLREAP